MTHRGTGLKYLGYTTQDLDKYKGSGTHWKLHVAKHGNDIDKKILLESDSEEEINHAALYLSEVYNVVDSHLFANLCIETGAQHTTLGLKPSEETKAKIGASMRGKKKTAEHRANVSAAKKGKNKGKQAGEKHPRFKGSLIIIHKATGIPIGTYTGNYELKAAGFCPSLPHQVAQGRKKSLGRTLPDGTKQRGAYTAMYAA